MDCGGSRPKTNSTISSKGSFAILFIATFPGEMASRIFSDWEIEAGADWNLGQLAGPLEVPFLTGRQSQRGGERVLRSSL